MTYVIMPATVDEAVGELNGIGELLTATEWHRAAIVATFVRLGERPGPGDRPELDDLKTPGQFVELGITGLKSKTTVAHYVQCWLDANGDNYPARGVRCRLPKVPWPPQAKNLGSRMTKAKVAEAIAELPAADLVDVLPPEQRHEVEREINRRKPTPDMERDRDHELLQRELGTDNADRAAIVDALGEGSRMLMHARDFAAATHRATPDMRAERRADIEDIVARGRDILDAVITLLDGVTDAEINALLGSER